MLIVFIVLPNPRTMKYILPFLLLVFCQFSIAQNLKLDRLISDSVQYEEHFGRAVSTLGNTLMIGAPNTDIETTEEVGRVLCYTKNYDQWELTQQILPNNREVFRHFGNGLQLTENFLFVRCARIGPTGHRSTHIIVFHKQENRWVETQQLRLDPNYNGGFGHSFEADNNQLIVSANAYHYADTSKTKIHHAEIFTLNGTKWTRTSEINSTQFDKYHQLKSSVSIDGNYAFVNGFYSDPDAEPEWFCTFTAKDNNGIIYQKTSPCISRSPRVFVFRKQGGEWENTQILKAWDPNGNGDFGGSIRSTNNQLIIAANSANIDENKSLSGAIFVYQRNNAGTYTPAQKFCAQDQHFGQLFGTSIDFYPPYLIVGAKKDERNAKGRAKRDRTGAAFLFVLENNGRFVQRQKMVDPKRYKMGFFGRAVAISDSHLVIGANQKLLKNEYSPYHNEGAVFTASLHHQEIPLIKENAPPVSVQNEVPNATEWESEQQVIKMYPNPSTGSFTLKRELAAASELRVLDITGKVVYSDTYYSTVKVIQIPNVKSGVYLVQIQTGQEFNTLKLIVH